MLTLTLRDISEIITKGTTPTTVGYAFLDSGVNFIKVESIDEEGNFVAAKIAKISQECNEKLKRSQLKKDDILISIAGVIGRIALVNDKVLPANINQALALVRIKDKRLNLRYLKKILQSEYVTKQYEIQKQGVAQINLSLKNVGDIVVPVPSIDEQQRIADELDKVSVLIEKRQKQLDKLDLLIKSRFNEMFLNAESQNWLKEELGNVCDVRDGTHDSPKYVLQEGFPLITSKNVANGEIDFKNASLISEEDYHKINQRSQVDIGDIIMPMIGTIGHPVIVNTNKKFAIKNLALIKFAQLLNIKVKNIYIKYMLESDIFEEIIKDLQRGGTQKFISLGDIRKIEFRLPPIRLQNQFANFVKHVEQSKSKIKNSLDKLITLKKALMQKYFG